MVTVKINFGYFSPRFYFPAFTIPLSWTTSNLEVTKVQSYPHVAIQDGVSRSETLVNLVIWQILNFAISTYLARKSYTCNFA